MIAILGLIPFRVWAYGVAIIAVVATIGIAINHFESVGAADATAKIERANNASQQDANQGEQPVDKCGASGGTWDRFEHVCNPGPGH